MIDKANIELAIHVLSVHLVIMQHFLLSCKILGITFQTSIPDIGTRCFKFNSREVCSRDTLLPSLNYAIGYNLFSNQNDLFYFPNTVLALQINKQFPKSRDSARCVSSHLIIIINCQDAVFIQRRYKISRAQTKMLCHHFCPHILYIVNFDGDFQWWSLGIPKQKWYDCDQRSKV